MCGSSLGHYEQGYKLRKRDTSNEVEIEIVSSLMAVAGAQYYFEFPIRSNWTSLVLYEGGSYEVTLVVEPIA